MSHRIKPPTVKKPLGERTLSIENVELEVMLAKAVYTTQQYTNGRQQQYDNSRGVGRVIAAYDCEYVIIDFSPSRLGKGLLQYTI